MTGGGAFNPTRREWLGSLPRHWSAPPLRRLARIENGRDYKDIEVDEGGYPVVGSGGAFARADAYLCEGPSVLLGRKGTIDRPQYVDEPFWAVDTSFFTLVARDVSTRFFFYFALTIPFGYFEAGTALPSMTKSDLYTIRCPLPPLDEQHALVDFLDRETEKIDTLVAGKQRLIELLQEKRTALISHAATRGLDPDVPMKDSGIEWLGEAPSHWQAGPLRRFWNVIDCKHKTVAFLDEGVPVASIGEVQGITVDLSGAKLTSPAEANELSEGGRKPGRGDVIISRNATVGEAALVDTDQDFCLGQDVSLIRSEGNDQRYLVYLLQSPGIRRQIESLMIGSTFRRINVGRIKELQVLRPQKRDQVTIGRFCDSAFRTHSDAVTRVEAAIGVLSEYRSALITAAVTGQIDVGAPTARRQAEGP